jgi:hypothetical protein
LQALVEEVVDGEDSIIDKDQVFGLRLHLAEELINVTLMGADGAQVDNLGAVILSHRSDRNRVFVDVHSDAEYAKLGYG